MIEDALGVAGRAMRAAVDAIDGHLGDTDIDDESPLEVAMRGLLEALTVINDKTLKDAVRKLR